MKNVEAVIFIEGTIYKNKIDTLITLKILQLNCIVNGIWLTKDLYQLISIN